MNTPAIVTVVGGGASGCLSAIQLARTAAVAGRSVHIVLVEPDGVGEGLAYSTHDPRHRLNVPAAKMSALHHDPQHFLRWMQRHVALDFPATGYAPRQYYADYLRQTLEETVAKSVGTSLEYVALRATDVRRHGRRLRLTLADGTSRPTDAVVLAVGHGEPSLSWAPAGLRRSARFVADPWRGGTRPSAGSGADVLLVGAGLTMTDMVQQWGRAGVRVHVTSRHGLMPLPHAAPASPMPAPALPDGPLSLPQARRFVFAHVRASGEWRRGIDALRPVTIALWSRLDDAARRDFLAGAARRWDRVRHRIDPAVHAWLEQRRQDGSLVVHTAEVLEARDTPGGLQVTLSDGSQITAAAVVNCTGASAGVLRSQDPLLMNLLGAGVVQSDELGLGVRADPMGRVLATDGSSPAVWAIGPLRRGELWESTAIPEIRAQAAVLARSVVSTLPGPRVVRRARDPYGLPLTASSAAADRYLDALGRILRVQSGAELALGEAVEADPDFALGHAALALLGTEWGAEVDVEAALEAADRAAPRADERERRFVDVATALVRRPGAESAAGLLAYIQTYPEDALAVSVAVPTIAFNGATEIPAEAWALVEGLEPVYRDDWWYRGLLAFTRQDQSRFAEADELARLALAVEPAAGHAVHAKTHAHYETGDHVAGLSWLDGWISRCGAAASHRAHFSWHAALHELALGDDRAAAARMAGQLAPPAVCGVRALIDSASLLWRGFTVGAWSALEVGPVLDAVPEQLLIEPPTPFVGLHSAVALAAAGDCGRLAQLRRCAAARDDAVFAQTIAPLADALMHLIHGDAGRAADGLLALTGVERLGGSAAQREIVEETLLYCAVQAHRYELAESMLSRRLDRRSSPRDASRRDALTEARRAAITPR